MLTFHLNDNYIISLRLTPISKRRVLDVESMNQNKFNSNSAEKFYEMYAGSLIKFFATAILFPTEK